MNLAINTMIALSFFLSGSMSIPMTKQASGTLLDCTLLADALSFLYSPLEKNRLS